MPFVTLGDRTPGRSWSLHYRVQGPEDAAITLVCVHELGGCLENYEAFVAELPADWRVISFDQRGAGASEHPTENFSVIDLADDLDRLVTELGVEGPFHLMGTAMGAVVALTYAISHSNRLASVVLCDGTGEITPEARRYILDRAERVRASGMRPVVETTFTNAFRGLPDPQADLTWRALRHRFLGNSPLSYAMHSEALAEVHFDDDALGRVRCPVHLLTGEHDFIWPPDSGYALSRRLPQARFEEVRGASHFPPVQKPAEVAARIVDVIRAAAAAPQP